MLKEKIIISGLIISGLCLGGGLAKGGDAAMEALKEVGPPYCWKHSGKLEQMCRATKSKTEWDEIYANYLKESRLMSEIQSEWRLMDKCWEANERYKIEHNTQEDVIYWDSEHHRCVYPTPKPDSKAPGVNFIYIMN